MDKELAWFAGLIDGEGCLSISVGKHHKSSLKFTPIFMIQMKAGAWVAAVSNILDGLGVNYYKRPRKNQIEISVRDWKNIIPLIENVMPFSVVKRPLMERFLKYRRMPIRNRFTSIDKARLDEMIELVDFVRAFNRGKNRPYKWTGKVVLDFFENKNKIARAGISEQSSFEPATYPPSG